MPIDEHEVTVSTLSLGAIRTQNGQVPTEVLTLSPETSATLLGTRQRPNSLTTGEHGGQ